jgi:hypothetical protein
MHSFFFPNFLICQGAREFLRPWNALILFSQIFNLTGRAGVPTLDDQWEGLLNPLKTHIYLRPSIAELAISARFLHRCRRLRRLLLYSLLRRSLCHWCVSSAVGEDSP